MGPDSSHVGVIISAVIVGSLIPYLLDSIETGNWLGWWVGLGIVVFIGLVAEFIYWKKGKGKINE